MTHWAAKLDAVTAHSSPLDSFAAVHASLREDVRRFVSRRVEPAAVEDLVQEIFLRVYESATQLRDEQSLQPWLFRIARNAVIDHLRRRKRHTSLDEQSEPSTPEPEVNFNAEMLAWFKPMMALLPEESRTALELTEMQGLTQRELAERSGLSLSGAKSRVQRAKQQLESVVRACCDVEVDVHGNFVACSPRNAASCKSC